MQNTSDGIERISEQKILPEVVQATLKGETYTVDAFGRVVKGVTVY